MSYPGYLAAKSTTFSVWGASARHFHPGGLVQAGDNDFLIGGSLWEQAHGWQTEAEAVAWSQAGFNAASLPFQNATAIQKGLAWAAAYGTLVLATPHGSFCSHAA